MFCDCLPHGSHFVIGPTNISQFVVVVLTICSQNSKHVYEQYMVVNSYMARYESVAEMHCKGRALSLMNLTMR